MLDSWELCSLPTEGCLTRLFLILIGLAAKSAAYNTQSLLPKKTFLGVLVFKMQSADQRRREEEQRRAAQRMIEQQRRQQEMIRKNAAIAQHQPSSHRH